MACAALETVQAFVEAMRGNHARLGGRSRLDHSTVGRVLKSALAHRTKIDWAGQVKQLLTADCPDAESAATRPLRVRSLAVHPRSRTRRRCPAEPAAVI
jgi:hypothetical protein